MLESLGGILDRLERVAAYDGPWLTLRQELPLLSERLEELRAREERLDDVLVVALVGGSGVGKSTLLNALAGDELAKTSEFRPCTSIPTIYHPPGVALSFAEDWKRVSGSALENLVIVDTPDSDTIAREHRELVIEALGQCDLIAVCADSEKYLDEATWSLLRPLQSERAMICVETKATQAPSVREDWLARLEKEGFSAAGYFRVNSVRTFDRKVSGGKPGADEYDFQDLERFLYKELTKERIRRIKRSNTSGLLSKTLTDLGQRVSSREGMLDKLEAAIAESESALAKAGYDIVHRRLFAEPHLWNYALGREMGLRAKGVVGTIFRLLEAARSIPARMANWSVWPMKAGAGHRAASMLTEKDVVSEHLDVSSDELGRVFGEQSSELALVLTKAGFDAEASGGDFDAYSGELGSRVEGVLRGPARDRVVSRAKVLTSWPLALGLDASPVVFFGYTAYMAVVDYFSANIWSSSEFLHAGMVLGIMLVVEIFVMSAAARFLSWSARRSAVHDLVVALSGPGIAFEASRGHLERARVLAGEIAAVQKVALGSGEEAS